MPPHKLLRINTMIAKMALPTYHLQGLLAIRAPHKNFYLPPNFLNEKYSKCFKFPDLFETLKYFVIIEFFELFNFQRFFVHFRDVAAFLKLKRPTYLVPLSYLKNGGAHLYFSI